MFSYDLYGTRGDLKGPIRSRGVFRGSSGLRETSGCLVGSIGMQRGFHGAMGLVCWVF